MSNAGLNPRDIGALVALVEQNRPSEAEQRARTLLAAHPNAGMLWKILSVALLRQDKDALQALFRTTELLPQDAEAHGNLAAALRDQGHWGAALASWRRALAIQPNDVETLVDAADAARALGMARDAVPLYQRALQIAPKRIEVRNNLGNAFLELAQYAEAAGCYRAALQIKPDDAQILCNLGNAQRLLGLLDEAMASSRRAAALDPGLSVAHNNVGLIFAARRQREEAVASYRQALRLNPRYVDVLNNLGNVLRELGARREALALYAQAAELDPKRAESHCNLGNILVELGRIEEGTECFRRALVLRPDWPLAHLSLATALRLQRRPADAESSCRAALAIDPNYVEAVSLLGELRADLGHFSEAQELFQRAVAINPDFAFAFSAMAAHRKMTSGDAAWLKGAETLLAKRPTLADEINLRYALGKYFDDVGHYDEAFDHYRRANELSKRYGRGYDGAKLARRVDEIVRCFDTAFVGRGQPLAASSELPVFVVGMPRSGTSLTEQILASHPAASGAGELTFWDAAYDAYRQAELEGNGGGYLSKVTGDYLGRLTASSGGAQRVIDKMPANFLYLGLIHAAFPRARIIHMQRHPIDTCLSIYFQHFFNMGPYANDLDDLVHCYGEYRRVTDHWRTVLPATALLEIPYEALIEDQEGWTRRMVDFIGLPWDPKCLEFHETERVVSTASKWQVRQKIYAASAGRWRNYEKFLGPLQRLADFSHDRCVK
jgi:tetratricopeptide (TPR) repeat protein